MLGGASVSLASLERAITLPSGRDARTTFFDSFFDYDQEHEHDYENPSQENKKLNVSSTELTERVRKGDREILGEMEIELFPDRC